MKHPLSLKNIVQFLFRRDIHLTDLQVHQLSGYHSLLITWSNRQNLFSGGDKRYLIERHFVPSFYFNNIIQNLTKEKIVDIGSGAGFPGVILQIMNPEISVTLIDSSHKKCLFLQEVKETLNLGFQIRNIRLNDLEIDTKSKFNIAVARFFGDLNTLWWWVCPVLKPSGILLVQKGSNYQYAVPENAVQIRAWNPDSSWISLSPNLSSKSIIEVKKIK